MHASDLTSPDDPRGFRQATWNTMHDVQERFSSTWAVVNTVSVCSPGCNSVSFAVDWPCRKLSRSLPVTRNLPQCDLQCPGHMLSMNSP